ncbi:MAG: class I SAM-dependent methyltransferase [Firmicutes bacterium]|nr:class I SAM-dependent methyltransferase [Bacillota bacterium]
MNRKAKPEHYFSKEPSSPSAQTEITALLRGREYRFLTEAGVFSRLRVDRGTRLLIEALPLPKQGRFLDLGCGYGPVGIAAVGSEPQLDVIMVDVNRRAVDLTKENARLNGVVVDVRWGEDFQVVKERDFSLIAANPPIRAGKQVVYSLLVRAKQHLLPGGVLCVVIRTKQGAKSLKQHLIDNYARVKTIDKGGGYRVFAAFKEESSPE